MKKPKNMSMIELGIYFGYPPCCIAEFLQFVVKYVQGKAGKRRRRKLCGTGYVPCKTCNKKSKKQLLAYIDKHRQCELPFPEEPVR